MTPLSGLSDALLHIYQIPSNRLKQEKNDEMDINSTHRASEEAAMRATATTHPHPTGAVTFEQDLCIPSLHL